MTILEVKLVGAAKWGRVKQGWICMDYVTMISYDDIPGNNSNNGSNSGNKGTGVDSSTRLENHHHRRLHRLCQGRYHRLQDA